MNCARVLLSLILFFSVGACDPQEPGAASSPSVSSPSPSFEVRPDSTGLLFIWLDDQGQFHTTSELKDIPDSARSLVRVLSETQVGSPDSIWVTDLTQTGASGSYPVRSLARSEWEARGAAAREARVQAATPTPAENPADPSSLPPSVDAIVYGAEWCKPCHQAENYLKSKGARVVKKDIEEHPEAGVEMRRKLKNAGLSGASIPVLDVGGTLLVGFSPRAVDAALRKAGVLGEK